MFNRQNRKKQFSGNLINFQDFVRYRSEKERIIASPVEENWKKAIVFEEMLELHQAREGCYRPGTGYNKKDFSSYYRYRENNESEQSEWQNNEDYQLKKYYKMVEGMESFDKLYQNQRMVKTAKKVEARRNRKLEQQSQEVPKKEKVFVTRKWKRYNEPLSGKNKLESFQSIIALKDRPKKQFLQEKKEIASLKKKAIKVYGIKFESEVKPAQQDADIQAFRKNQAIIYNKFMAPFNQRVVSTHQDLRASELAAFQQNHNLPDGLLKRDPFSCPVTPRRAMLKTGQSYRKKRYLRII